MIYYWFASDRLSRRRSQCCFQTHLAAANLSASWRNQHAPHQLTGGCYLLLFSFGRSFFNSTIKVASKYAKGWYLVKTVNIFKFNSLQSSLRDFDIPIYVPAFLVASLEAGLARFSFQVYTKLLLKVCSIALLWAHHGLFWLRPVWKPIKVTVNYFKSFNFWTLFRTGKNK